MLYAEQDAPQPPYQDGVNILIEQRKSPYIQSVYFQDVPVDVCMWIIFSTCIIYMVWYAIHHLAYLMVSVIYIFDALIKTFLITVTTEVFSAHGDHHKLLYSCRINGFPFFPWLSSLLYVLSWCLSSCLSLLFMLKWF